MATVEALPQEKPWTFPTNLQLGQRVVCSTDASFGNPGAGLIIGLENASAFVWFMAGDSRNGFRQGPLEDCWYEGDPRIKAQPHLIDENEGRCIFRLADSEERINTYSEQFEAMEQALEVFIDEGQKREDRISTLEKTVGLLEAEVAKLTRSRPSASKK